MIKGALAVAVGVWVAAVLFHTSPCERAKTAALPFRYAASAWLYATEYIAGYDKDDASRSTESAYKSASNLAARLMYARADIDQLCASDPIMIMRNTGLLDHRDLVAPKIDLTVEVKKEQLTFVYHDPSEAREAASAAEESHGRDWLAGVKRYWAYALAAAIIGWLLIRMLSQGNKATYLREVLSRPINDLRDILTHVLPRKAVRPDLEKRPTDRTDAG